MKIVKKLLINQLKIIEKKYDKKHSCILIQAVVG